MEVVKINNLNNARELLYNHNKEIGRTLSDEELLNGIDKFLKFGDVLGFVDDCHIIAMLNLYCNDYDTLNAYICNLYVLDAYGGKHYGKKLVKSAISIAKKRKFKNIFLHVNGNNTAAIELYKSFDFTFTGNKKNNDLEMVLKLW